VGLVTKYPAFWPRVASVAAYEFAPPLSEVPTPLCPTKYVLRMSFSIMVISDTRASTNESTCAFVIGVVAGLKTVVKKDSIAGETKAPAASLSLFSAVRFCSAVAVVDATIAASAGSWAFALVIRMS
jgi:hypothetical protein